MLDLQSTVTADFGTAKYYKGASTQRKGYLTSIKGWSIDDGGQSSYQYPSQIDYIQKVIQGSLINDSVSFIFETMKLKKWLTIFSRRR
jgi:hypothetical protein